MGFEPGSILFGLLYLQDHLSLFAFPLLVLLECESETLYRAGRRFLKDGSFTQRYLCRKCGYRFSKSKSLNKQFSKGSICQIGATPKAHGLVENLTKQEPLKDGLAGATIDVKGRLVNFLWHLKKQNYSERTINTYASALKRLQDKGANLEDSESVKEVMAGEEWSDNYKHILSCAYTLFLSFMGLSWKPRARIRYIDMRVWSASDFFI